MTREQCEKKMQEIGEEIKRLVNEANSFSGTPKYFELIDLAISKTEEMSKLDSLYKKLLLEDIENGSLTAIQRCINYIFGSGS